MYVFKFKRNNSLFSKSIKVVGHNYLSDQDKMVLYKEDGSLQEICNWKQCEVSLGADWVLVTKKKMEQQAGTTIPLNVGN